jgi:hypothetical protein
MSDSSNGRAINPFVTYLNALSAGKSHVLELGAKDFTIQTNTLTALSSKIQSDTPGIVILTGNAGHGKTHLCAASINQTNPTIDWQRACELIQEFGRASASLPLGDRKVEVWLIKDLTELSITEARNLLTDAIKNIKNRLTIVCANEGRLRSVTEKPEMTEHQGLTDIHDALLRSLESHESEIGAIHIFNLNLQKISASSDTEHGSILSQLLNSWTAEENWKDCAECEKRERCPIRLNGEILNSNSSTTIRPFIENSIYLSELLGYQFTVRQALVALAAAITNEKKCADIHQNEELLVSGDLRSESIFHTLFKGHERHKFNLLFRAFHTIDPGSMSSNLVDGQIDLVDFESELGTWWGDLSGHIQKEHWEPSVEDWRFMRRFTVMTRRKFSDSPTSLGSTLDIKYLPEFDLLISNEQAELRNLVLRIFRGLEAIQGIRSEDSNSTRLSIADQSFSDPSLGLDGIATKNTRRDPEGTRLLASRIRFSDTNFQVEEVPPGENGMTTVNHFSTRVFLRPQNAPVTKRMAIDYVDFLYLLSAAEGLNANQFFAGQSLRLLRVLDSWSDEDPMDEITVLSKGKPVNFEWNGIRLEVDNG